MEHYHVFFTQLVLHIERGNFGQFGQLYQLLIM